MKKLLLSGNWTIHPWRKISIGDPIWVKREGSEKYNNSITQLVSSRCSISLLRDGTISMLYTSFFKPLPIHEYVKKIWLKLVEGSIILITKESIYYCLRWKYSCRTTSASFNFFSEGTLAFNLRPLPPPFAFKALTTLLRKCTKFNKRLRGNDGNSLFAGVLDDLLFPRDRKLARSLLFIADYQA